MFFLHFLPVPFSACDPATLTLERLADGCIELIGHLCRTLGKGKVYLIGGSWWTELGDLRVRQGPERAAGDPDSGWFQALEHAQGPLQPDNR